MHCNDNSIKIWVTDNNAVLSVCKELNVYGNIHIENDKRRFGVFADGNFISNNDFCYKEYVEENNNYLYRK